MEYMEYMESRGTFTDEDRHALLVLQNNGRHMERTIGSGVQDVEDARAALAKYCERHGMQSELARRCGVITPYINRLVKQPGARPSMALRVALERETGIPAVAWSVEHWTRQKAADVVAGQISLEPYPGYTAQRCGVTPEGLRDVLEGRAPVPDAMRQWAAGVGVPAEAWDR